MSIRRAAGACLILNVLLLPAVVRGQSTATPSLTITAGRADFLDDGRLVHGVVGGGVEWLPFRHVAVGPEILYMVGPGDDRDLFVLGVARVGILPLRSRVAPFVTVGAGTMTHSDTVSGGRPFRSTEAALVLGAGVRVNAWPRVYVAPEVTLGWEPHLRVSVNVGMRLP